MNVVGLILERSVHCPDSHLIDLPACLLPRSVATARIRVVGLVVHDEFVVHEVKRIRPRLVRIGSHFVDEFLTQLRKFVNMFTRVARVRYTETEFEVERLEELIAEVVPFDHTEAGHRPIADSELHSARDASSSLVSFIFG